MDPAITTLCVLAVAAFLFVTELIPLAVTAMAACTMLGILGVLPAKQVYAGLSNSTVVLFGGMFVIGAAMFKTGLAEAIGIAVVKKAGTGEIRLMGAIMLVTIILSSVSSNTGTVACLMPVIVGICQAAKIPASKELMPLAIAANVGGTITMIGTPPKRHRYRRTVRSRTSDLRILRIRIHRHSAVRYHFLLDTLRRPSLPARQICRCYGRRSSQGC